MCNVATSAMVRECKLAYLTRACFSAASVSAVSPDWLMVTTSVRGFGTLSR